MAASGWTPVRTGDGAWTLRHAGHGATCHSLAGAWQEARERYADACRLPERAAAGAERLRVLDVGAGLGLNLAAALQAVAGTPARLEAVALEADRAVLAIALELADWPGEVERWHEVVRESLARGLGAQGAPVPFGSGGSLRLLIGDARETIRRLPEGAAGERFDAVFLDPFAPQVEPDLWQEPFLRELFLRAREDGILSTYSSALSVRLALSRAGFRVGRGPRVGTKSSGTLASGSLDLPALDARTARRLERRLAGAAGAGGSPRRRFSPGGEVSGRAVS